MRTIPGRRDARRLTLISLITGLALASCGGDDSQGPDDNGNGDETVVLSASNAGDWSAIIVRTFNSPAQCATWDSDRSTDVGDVLSNGIFRLRTYSYMSGTCCVFERYTCSIQSTKLVDLTLYKTARLKGQVRIYGQRAGEVGCGIDVDGDFCGLDLISERLCTYGSVVTKDLDLNIADALGCPRGTFYLDISVGGWCGTGTQTDNEVYVEVRDLRIIVTK